MITISSRNKIYFRAFIRELLVVKDNQNFGGNGW